MGKMPIFFETVERGVGQDDKLLKQQAWKTFMARGTKKEKKNGLR